MAKFVAAKWQKGGLGAPDVIKAIDDEGAEYFIPSEDCDVPPWPQFLAEGGTIEPADEPKK